LLAVADGHTPTLSAKLVDPTAGQTTFKLKRHDLDARDPTLVFRGRVLDEKGNPVPDAVVDPIGFQKGDGGQFGGLKGFDELALTNEKGEFRLGVPEKGLGLCGQVSARFFARRTFNNLPTDRPHDLTLVTGVTVTGRVLRDGKPLPGGAVGLVQQNRGVEAFVGEYKAAADANGVFRIPNVVPDEKLFAYGLMDSLKGHGAIRVRPVRTRDTGTELDLGDVTIEPGYRLSGRVVLSDAKAVPAGTRVIISRDQAWDSQQTVVAKDGTFSFEGLPAEEYNLSANIRGYHVSPKNLSLDLMNPFGLLGTVRENTTGLKLLYEPGEGNREDEPWSDKRYEEYKRRREAPLRGAPNEPAR
jgi:hypothetical protein